ncbi:MULTISPECIES: helix-turn-helix domain-containing protein [unclassified Cytobacillus]|uniref:helix-turn-helix domain-containing protein n=1 Tax=unclassified Cytobacillus TaxID=2675268 RepID=UPI0020416722|nr:helix-turn-helix domain-containing protein [Cytobacillus sp. AMY 15.2]MCM3093831.1 helix-turn-helix domain-containing protein [Cytobacillus sp. AMY 15.2]
MSQQKIEIKGTGKVFNKKEKQSDTFFVKMPSDLMHYVHIPGYEPEYNYLYTILVDYYNPDQGYAYPTEPQICRKYGKKEKAVRRHLAVLERVGLIKSSKPKANKIYVPYQPLSKEELFEKCPEARRSYLDYVKAEDAEKARDRRGKS